MHHTDDTRHGHHDHNAHHGTQKSEKPKADKPKADKPKADKPKADKPKADKPKADKWRPTPVGSPVIPTASTVTPATLAATGKYADHVCKIIPMSMEDLPPIPATAKPPEGAIVAETMSDFEWGDSLVYPRGKAPEVPNITQLGPRTINIWMRHRGDPRADPTAWYDGDRSLEWNESKNGEYHDKSRAELYGIGGKKKPYGLGETWLIGTTVRLNPDFVPYAGYCNIMQPVGLQSFVMLSGIKGDIVSGCLYALENGVGSEMHAVREFTLKRGEWTTLVVRLRVAKDGEYALSVNGDAFKSYKLDTTKSGKGGPPYEGTWGLYGSGTFDVNRKPLRDSVVQHTNMWCKKIAG